MRITSAFARRVLFTLLLLTSFLVCAESPFVTAQNVRYRINLISNKDWIEESHLEGEVPRLSISLVDELDNKINISTFFREGPALPELVSIFKSELNCQQLLFAIVKWHYYLPGSHTEGDYYEVHAYELKIAGGGAPSFSENKLISDFFGSGLDGKHEGKVSHFRFKDSASIRRVLSLYFGKYGFMESGARGSLCSAGS